MNREAFETKIGPEFLGWRKTMLEFDQLENAFGMNLTVKQSFNEVILQYCKENLVTVAAYIQDPFVTQFVTDEVRSI